MTSFGGAERVLQNLHELYPSAPVFTSVFDARKVPADIRAWDVRPSVLQRFPMVHAYSRALLPLMPWAFQRFDLSGFDAVITTSSAFSKNVTLARDAINLCYCLTPPRYLWDLSDEYLARFGGTRTLAPVVNWLRARDLEAARGVDEFIAISHHVAERIRRTYARDARVIYPPVDTGRIQPTGAPPEDFYLVVSRLVRYKRVDLAIEACNRLRRPLVVVGTGPALPRLRALAGDTIHFAGALDDASIVDLYSRCRAFLFPGLDDFGITPVEAQAAGRPVIAYGSGGAAETVTDGVTGVLCEEQSVGAMVAAIERLDDTAIDPAACRTNAERFDAAIFRERIVALMRERIAGA